MFGSLFFGFWRIVELVTLIPPIGMLVSPPIHPSLLPAILTAHANNQSFFIHGFVQANQLTPSYILVLFIVCVLAAVWALDTLIRHSTTKRSAIFVSFVDLCFVAAFIAAVYQLRGIAQADCSSFTTTNSGSFYISLGPFGYYGRQSNSALSLHIDRTCAMLKASFAFGIMNTLFFFWTAIFALFMHKHHHHKDEVVTESMHRRRSSHGSRRGHSSGGHRHRSSSRRPHYYV
jgi:hypothetical protein